MIAIIDYGMGNLKSLNNSIKRLGYKVEIIHDPVDLLKYDKAILPGVGSFAKASETIFKLRWNEAIFEFIRVGKPFLGICLGMQLMFDRGEEHGINPGLSLFKGEVKLLELSDRYCLPHVGWNEIEIQREHTIFEGIKKEVDFYFVHSYHCIPQDKSDILTTTNYGIQFVSSVGRENVLGVQFHPEKSQPAGLKLLENFFEWKP